ncbi:MAG: 4-phosphoerythronate dehydrogenase [Bacteroidales bacterium]|nr:MAG: 4-phosphoerythronate dehydrogenase [Bacteroidales bacterium]
MKLVADINIPYLKGVFDSYFESIILLPASEITPEIVKDADALVVRTRTFCNADLLEGSAVKFIGSATIGFDHIDTDYCNSRGIEWVNAPGCNSGAVQQWVAAALLQISKSKGISLEGKVLGVTGVGNVGRRIVDLGLALGMRVICCDPPRKREEHLADFVDLKTIAQQSDFITFHVPLSFSGIDATNHMVDSALIETFKDNVVLINSSRGEVIETNSLISAITNKKIVATALDVWENEPNISQELLKLVTFATPHIAGYSVEGKVNGTRMVVDALSKFFNLGIHPWIPIQNPMDRKEIIENPINLVDTVIQTYNIVTDDNSFRKSSIDFEKYRSNYTLRREFSGYRIIRANNSIASTLQKLGFEINTR